MKLKINKACDLSSISVLPPHSRKTNVTASGTDSSVFGRNQASQLRSQQSQISYSQLGISSQLSQNSHDENVTIEQRFGSRDRDNSWKRISSLAPISYTREEAQIPLSRSSSNHMSKWCSTSTPENRCRVSEELEHRIGLMETSLNRFGMILDSVQSDVMQANKAVKELSVETEGILQKLIVHDNYMQLMIKGLEEIKASVDGKLKSILEHQRKDPEQYKLQKTVTVLSSLPDLVEARLLKLQHELRDVFTKEIKEVASIMKPPNHNHPEVTILPPKRKGLLQSQREQLSVKENRVVPPKVYAQATLIPKRETGSWNSFEPKPAAFTREVHNLEQIMRHKQEKIRLEKKEIDQRVIIDSDEEIDEVFSCLLEEKERGEHIESYLIKEAKEETERILRKARKKRKYFSTILLD